MNEMKHHIKCLDGRMFHLANENRNYFHFFAPDFLFGKWERDIRTKQA